MSAPPHHIDPATACTHCGLPVGAHPVGQGPFFCCSGCAVVYEALQHAGLGETFYRLKHIGGIDNACPVPSPKADPMLSLALDHDSFLDKHTTLHEDGSRSTTLFLDGVHCAACVWLVERLPAEEFGVLSSRLDLPRARLTVRWYPQQITLSAIAQWLARFGYAAHPLRNISDTQRTTLERRLLIKMGISWALAGNVMLLAFALYAGLDLMSHPAMATAARWASLLLAVPAVFYGGSTFFQRAWASIRFSIQQRDLRRLHMDTPIAIGILAGFGHSAWATVSGYGEVWFDSITVLIAALLTARWLQLRSRRLAGDATERLLALIPTMVRRLTPDGDTTIVPVTEVVSDDHVLVPAGEVFPVDGVVIAGHTSVNNAVLTGESQPEILTPGMAVTAGATNLTAPVHVCVHAAGAATRVGKLLTWIRDAATHRAPVILLVDRISGYFVLAVLSLAVITGVLWSFLRPEDALPHVVALLVITCPCALGMATPLAMAIAAGRAARIGLFIKSDEATQLLTTLDAVVLDKTGTLTEGAMSLVAFEGDDEALALAVALEDQSNHPVALALTQTPPVAVPDVLVHSVENVIGYGVRGVVDGKAVAIGQPEWIAAQASAPSPTLERTLNTCLSRGDTPVAIAVDGRYVALLALGDPLRHDARPVLETLQKAGKACYLLSGDHPDVVHAVAHTLGIPPAHAHGRMTPEDKQAFIEQLQRENGWVVAMMGDGVNDAAALQAADVGIAVQGGTTASLVAADVFITRAGVQPLMDLLQGTHQVMRVIRRTLAFSLGYNLLGAAAAMAGLISPLIAAIAMPISSLFVVASSIWQDSFTSEMPYAPPRATSPAQSVPPVTVPHTI